MTLILEIMIAILIIIQIPLIFMKLTEKKDKKLDKLYGIMVADDQKLDELSEVILSVPEAIDEKVIEISEMIGKLAELNPDNAKQITDSILKSPETRDFLFDVIYNLIQHALKANLLQPYMNDFYNTLKGHVMSKGGVSAKVRKKATKEVIEHIIASQPMGKYAKLLFGDEQIDDFLGISENPQKALEKLKVIVGMLKEIPQSQIDQYTQQ